MRDLRSRLVCALLGAASVLFCGAAQTPLAAQGWASVEGSTTSGPSLEEYLKQVGPDAKLVAHGSLTIDGQRVNCGKRPTVLNPNFDSWGGAFPGFVILNNNKIAPLSTPTKLYVYSHECGHQFVGANEGKADLFAIRRGVRWGWLDALGLEDICTFISQLKGDSVHPPGTKRCETMRRYYRELIEKDKTRAASAPKPRPATKARTLGPQ